MIEMSRRPPRMKLRASLRLASGTTAVGADSYQSTSRLSKALNLKK